MKPTEDKVTKQAIIYQMVKFMNLYTADQLLDDIMQTMEMQGYHKD
jgi:hypothetical protein